MADSQLPVREIVEQARIVCTGAMQAYKLPNRINRLAERAIATRNSFTQRFKNLLSRTAEDQKQDEAHDYFTQTLRHALDMLQRQRVLPYDKCATANCANILDSSAAFITPPVVPPSSAQAEPTSVLPNVFAHLDIETCEEIEWSLSFPCPPKKTKQSAKKSKHQKKGSLKDVSQFNDVRMRIFCFFTDLHKLREEAMDLWKEYKDGAQQLIPVAMATNAALVLAERMELDLLVFLNLEGKSSKDADVFFCGVASPYSTILGSMSSVSLGKINLTDPAAVAHLPNNQDWFCDMGIILSKLASALIVRKREKRRFCDVQALELTGKLKYGDAVEIWPRVQTMQFALLHSSCYPDLIFHSKAFLQLTNLDRLMTPILMDTIVRHEQLWGSPHVMPRSVSVDEISRALLRLEDGHVGAAALLGCAIIQDLNSLFGSSNAVAHDELLRYAAESRAIIALSQIDLPPPFPPDAIVWHQNDKCFPSQYPNAAILSRTEAFLGWISRKEPSSSSHLQDSEISMMAWTGVSYWTNYPYRMQNETNAQPGAGIYRSIICLSIGILLECGQKIPLLAVTCYTTWLWPVSKLAYA